MSSNNAVTERSLKYRWSPFSRTRYIEQHGLLSIVRGEGSKVYDAANIRNVALVGHSGSGKTQLASAILTDAGMVNRFGKVDDGTTVTDYDEEEISRKHTLAAGLAYGGAGLRRARLHPGLDRRLRAAGDRQGDRQEYPFEPQCPRN